MNVGAFRHFYEYHFAENRKIWEAYILPLSYEQFTRKASYSRGSLRDQVIHMISADHDWFCGLRDIQPKDLFTAAKGDDRAHIRERWDRVEHDMRRYLAGLRDEMLFSRPFPEGEDQNLILWQVLLHVVNHGTDHRAQVLRLLNDLGVETGPQDYIFYAFEHPAPGS